MDICFRGCWVQIQYQYDNIDSWQLSPRCQLAVKQQPQIKIVSDASFESSIIIINRRISWNRENSIQHGEKYIMSGRNNLPCFVCLNIFPARTLSRIDGVNNNIRREIAIQRRDGLNHPPLEVTDCTRLCINCSRSINEEIAATEQDPTWKCQILSTLLRC